MKLLEAHEHHLGARKKLSPLQGFLIGGLLAIVGVVVVATILAAGTPVAFEPEAGTLTSSATTTTVTGQSGSGAVKFAAALTPTPSVSPGSCSGATNTPDGSDGAGGCWPGTTTTGVPAGTPLSTFPDSGACHLTIKNQIIDAKTFNCDIVVQATGIVITRSNIIGRIVANDTSGSITISDSTINGGQQETFPTVAYNNIALRRVEVIGGQHSIQCSQNCDIQDSWMHNQYLPASSAGHVNAFISNGGNGFTLKHNTFHCTVAPTQVGGCTADVSFFGDFSPIANIVMDRNLLIARNDGAGYCLQAGWNPGKPYPIPSNVSVTNNVFQKGPNGHCGIYGVYTAYFVGNSDVWSGNKYDDGTVIP